MFSSAEYSDVPIDGKSSTESDSAAETDDQRIRNLKLRVKELEEKVESQRKRSEMYERKIQDLEGDREEMYLVMFKKGQQAAHHDIIEDKFIEQLTEDRIALRFLHDAFYCYLMKKGDGREHLQRIMTMLHFSEQQMEQVAKVCSKKNCN